MSILDKGHNISLLSRYWGPSIKQETIIQALMELPTSVLSQTLLPYMIACVYSGSPLSSCVMYYTINKAYFTLYVNSACFIISAWLDILAPYYLFGILVVLIVNVIYCDLLIWLCSYESSLICHHMEGLRVLLFLILSL